MENSSLEQRDLYYLKQNWSDKMKWVEKGEHFWEWFYGIKL